MTITIIFSLPLGQEFKVNTFIILMCIVYNTYHMWCLNLSQRTLLSRVTALAILSGEDGLNALTTAVENDPTPTPLHHLVKEMPGDTLPQS